MNRQSDEQAICSLSMLGGSEDLSRPFWGPFFNNYMFIPHGDFVINVLAWQTLCKEVGFLQLRRQVDHSKVFFPLSIMQC